MMVHSLVGGQTATLHTFIYHAYRTFIHASAFNHASTADLTGPDR